MIKELKDIKPIVQIPDNSLVIMMIVVVFTLLVLGVLLYLLFKKPKRRKKPTIKELKLKILKNIDYNDSKDIAYTFTTDTDLFIDENNKARYEEIVKKLEPYKYKKEIPTMPQSLKNEIKEFIKALS